ncbi:DNA repair protein RecO [Thermonema rossianum]|uniref:DNA repair protein RecO n=1 Tax=Thermonema rossianum TaxID=55505 RepID=UPI000571A970|nr:recombination protein O N-terminal domain-containing protein [Thermonema rossianum]
MLSKTQAIILHTLKYRESSLIVHTYSREQGRLSLVVNGVRKAKPSFPMGWFQHMSVLDMVVYLPKQSGGLGRLKEATPLWLPMVRLSHPLKVSILYFLAELLYKTRKEETADPAMFDFVHHALLVLEETPQLRTYALWFLLHYLAQMGLMPAHETQLLQELNAHTPYHFDASLAPALACLNAPMPPQQVPLPPALRSDLLEALPRLISEHTTHFEEIRSLSILRDIM